MLEEFLIQNFLCQEKFPTTATTKILSEKKKRKGYFSFFNFIAKEKDLMRVEKIFKLEQCCFLFNQIIGNRDFQKFHPLSWNGIYSVCIIKEN